MNKPIPEMSVEWLIGMCRWLPLDTPERQCCEAAAVELARRNKLLEEAINELLIRHPGGMEISRCHRGIVPIEECSTCKAVMQAKAALKANRGEV